MMFCYFPLYTGTASNVMFLDLKSDCYYSTIKQLFTAGPWQTLQHTNGRTARKSLRFVAFPVVCYHHHHQHQHHCHDHDHDHDHQHDNHHPGRESCV